MKRVTTEELASLNEELQVTKSYWINLMYIDIKLASLVNLKSISNLILYSYI